MLLGGIGMEKPRVVLVLCEWLGRGGGVDELGWGWRIGIMMHRYR